MLSLIFALLFSSSAQALMVISDVDDTIKITNSGNTWQAAWSGLFTRDVFPAMPEIYQNWAQEGAQLHFVTASPSLIRRKIQQLLATYQIPYASLTLRRNLVESKLSYKVRSIRAIMDQHPDEDVILIGDDVGQDPEVFVELERLYPSRVLKSYIRPVNPRTALPTQIPYITAFDIANEEHLDGRMKYTTMLNLARLVVMGDADKLFPRFAWCPADLSQTSVPTETSPFSAAYAVKARIESICRLRQSAIAN